MPVAPGEILVVDGGSDDGTRDLAARFGGRVRVIDNPGVTAASAMNVGLAAAVSDLIVRADAHTLYATDYVRRSVEVLEGSGADWVGGRMVPVGRSAFGRAVAAVRQVTDLEFVNGGGTGSIEYTAADPAVTEVAAHLCGLVAGEPQQMAPELAGPRVESVVDMVRQLIRRRGQHRPVIGLRIPGAAGKGMANGALLPTQPGPRGHQTYAEWLAALTPDNR